MSLSFSLKWLSRELLVEGYMFNISDSPPFCKNASTDRIPFGGFAGQILRVLAVTVIWWGTVPWRWRWLLHGVSVSLCFLWARALLNSPLVAYTYFGHSCERLCPPRDCLSDQLRSSVPRPAWLWCLGTLSLHIYSPQPPFLFMEDFSHLKLCNQSPLNFFTTRLWFWLSMYL